MTRFMLWFLIWFGIDLIEHLAKWHHAGGWKELRLAERELYSVDALVFGELLNIATFFAIWFGIISREIR